MYSDVFLCRTVVNLSLAEYSVFLSGKVLVMRSNVDLRAGTTDRYVCRSTYFAAHFM